MSSVGDVLANNASTLESVVLMHNTIGDDGLEKLSDGLKWCSKLKELLLKKNGLTSDSGSTLCDVLSSLPSLELLSVTGNDLEDYGIAQLAHGLQFCTSLERLYILETACSSQSFPVLHRLLLSLPYLQLRIGVYDLSEQDLRKLFSCVPCGRVSFHWD